MARPRRTTAKAQAAETFRSLVSRVDLVPEEGTLAIFLRGDLAAILRFAAGKKNPDLLSEAGVFDDLLSQASMVAGARNYRCRHSLKVAI